VNNKRRCLTLRRRRQGDRSVRQHGGDGGKGGETPAARSVI
jgi:hypothetical protein